MSTPDLIGLSDRALKILIIVMLAGQPVGMSYIRARYKKPLSDNSLKYALYELTEEHLIARTAYRGECWAATVTARQLILGETSPGEVSSDQTSETSPREVSNLSGRGFDALASISSSRDTEPDQRQPLLLGQSETSLGEVSHPQAIHSPTVLSELDEAGIGEPKRSQIAAIQGITADYIRGHVLKVVDEGQEIGLAIHRIVNGYRAPALNERRHLKNCTCDDCRAAQYLKWQQ